MGVIVGRIILQNWLNLLYCITCPAWFTLFYMGLWFLAWIVLLTIC